MSEETQLVLVECVSMFRMRYLVEVPVGIDSYGNDKKDWALDTVSMEEAKEFSQQHIGETIVSSRVISKEEALTLCDQDNDYAKSWPEEKKIEQFFTTVGEHVESV
jgi:bifunctional ADP-heptose synthase (sugar kinase/adenylyltransferase)